jgi:hypothetical protein
MPKRIKQHEMIRPADRLLGRRSACRDRALVKVFGAAQQREVEFRDLNALDLVTANARSAGIRIRERVSEMVPARLWVALQDRDALSHGFCCAAGRADTLI